MAVAGSGCGALWECDTDGGFVAYGEEDTAQLERTWASGARGAPVAVRGGISEVDLRAMRQRNRSTGREREVRRTALVAAPGTAPSPLVKARNHSTGVGRYAYSRTHSFLLCARPVHDRIGGVGSTGGAG